MKQQLFSFRSSRSLVLPSAATSAVLVIYLVLSVGLALLMLSFPLLGLIGALVINLIVLFFMRSRFGLPVSTYSSPHIAYPRRDRLL